MLSLASQKEKWSEDKVAMSNLYTLCRMLAHRMGWRSRKNSGAREADDIDDAQHEAFIAAVRAIEEKWDRKRPIEPFVITAVIFELRRFRKAARRREIQSD